MPLSEAKVGEPYEKVQITLQDLAHRIERIRLTWREYGRRLARRTLTPLDRNELQASMFGDLDVVRQQCMGFARNRGVEIDFQVDLEDTESAARVLRRSVKKEERHRGLGLQVIGVLAICEAWLEANGLLLNVSPPPQDWLDDVWKQILEDERRSAPRKARASSPPAPPAEMAKFDAELEALGDDDEPENEDDEPEVE